MTTNDFLQEFAGFVAPGSTVRDPETFARFLDRKNEEFETERNVQLLQEAADIGVTTFPGLGGARNVSEANEIIRRSIATRRRLQQFPEALARREEATSNPLNTFLTGLTIAAARGDPFGELLANSGAQVGGDIAGIPGAIAGGLVGGAFAPIPRLRPPLNQPISQTINPALDVPGLGAGVAGGRLAGQGAQRAASAVGDAAGRSVQAIERRAIPAIERARELPARPLQPRKQRIRRKPVTIRLDEGVVNQGAQFDFERGLGEIRRFSVDIPDSVRRRALPIEQAINDPDIAASLRPGDIVSYTGLRGRPVRLRVRPNGELIREGRMQPLPAISSREIIDIAIEGGPRRNAARISMPTRGRRAIFDRIDLASRTGGDEVITDFGLRQLPQLSPDEASAMKEFIRALPDEYFDDIALSIRRQPGAVRGDAPVSAGGAFDPELGLIELFTSVIRQSPSGVSVEDVFIHEIAHNLNQFLDPDDIALLRRQFDAEKAAFEGGSFRSQRFGEDAPSLTYRFSSFGEWFAETFTDRALRDLYPDEMRRQVEGVIGHVKHIVVGLYNWLVRRGRVDEAERVYRDLLAGTSLKRLSPQTERLLRLSDDGSEIRRTVDEALPVGEAAAASDDVPTNRPRFDEATETELRQVAERARAQAQLDGEAGPSRVVRDTLAPAQPQDIRRDFGQQLGLDGVETVQARNAINSAETLVASRDSVNKLRHILDVFARPIARRAAEQNSEVFKQRLARGLDAAKAAEARGDFQAAARIQQAAQRGARVEDIEFQPLARRADPDDPFSDVVGFGRPTRFEADGGATNLVSPDELLSTEDIRLLHGQIRNFFAHKGLPQSGVNAQFALNKALLGQRLQPSEINLLEQSLGIGNRLRNLGRDRLSSAIDLLAVPKTLRSAIDMSGFLRQAGFYVINLRNLAPTANGAARRKTIREAFQIMFRAYKGKDRVAREVWEDISTRDPALFEALTQRPNGRRLHLYSPSETDLSIRDEAFLSTLFTRLAQLDIRQGSVPGRLARLPFKLIGEGVERSEVAFTAMLNRIRYDSVEQLVNDAKLNGNVILDDAGQVVDGNFLDNVTNWANITTGRGNLGGTVAGRTVSAEGFAPLLNGVFWAPRLATARAETLVRGTSRVGRESLRIARTGDVLGRNLTAEQLAIRRTAEEFVGFFGAGMTILGLGVLAKQAGMPGFDQFEVELDPRSSDFGKGRFANTRFDFWGGHQQFIRTLAQISTGQRKTTTTGDLVDTNFAETNFRFVRSKLAPGVPTIVTNELARETFLGEELSAPSAVFGTERVRPREQQGFTEQIGGALTPGGSPGSVRTRDLGQQFLPLTMFEYLDVMRERGMLEGAAMSVPPFFGAGTQTFGEQSTERPGAPASSARSQREQLLQQAGR